LNASLVNAGQMKRIVNASQNFAILMIKHEDVEESKAFQGYESSLKSDFIEVSNSCDKMFQESNKLPPKRGKQNEVNLQQDASLLNIGVNKMLVLKHAEVKNKMQDLFDKANIGPKTSSYRFHDVLALNKDGAWRWRSHLIKSRAKCKAKHVKHCHDDNVQRERNFNLF